MINDNRIMDIGIAKVFGRVIRRQRKIQGISQANLAERSGLHLNTIFFIEKGNDTKLSTQYFIAKGLGVSLSDLLKQTLEEYNVTNSKNS